MLNKSLLTLALALALTGCGKAPEQTTNTASVETQAAVTQLAQAPNPWWQDAVFYQIWPRSF